MNMKKSTGKKVAVKKHISAQGEIKKLQALTTSLQKKSPAISTKLILADHRALKEKNR